MPNVIWESRARRTITNTLHCIHPSHGIAFILAGGTKPCSYQSSSTSSSGRCAKMARNYSKSLASDPMALASIHDPFVSGRRIGWIVTGRGCQGGTVVQKLLEKSGTQWSFRGRCLAYPALCLLQPPPRGATSSNRSMTLLFRAEGNSLLAFSADQLSPILQSCVHRHHTILAEQEARRIEREQETLLRRQQDEEYQAALRADQERERQQAEAAAEEERLRREEEERIAEEERQAKAVVENAREKLRDPPSSGGAMIRFVLPTGQKLNRRFHGDDTIGSCKAFVRLHCHENEIEMGTIGLSTSFPKKSYNDDNDLTLEDAGLKPQAVLMVQDLDA
eukprot:scaffold4724_cov166-Amphora_coffeaeformis.AAC.4